MVYPNTSWYFTLQRPGTRALALVPVYRVGVDAVALELLREAVRAVLGPGEYQNLLPVVALHQVCQQFALAVGVDHVHVLRDQRDRLVPARDLDLRGILLELRGQLADIVGEGRREEQRLALRWNERDDALDVGDESHVEHAVALVEHQDLHLAEVHGLLADEVEEPPRRRHEDLDALLERLDLRIDVDAAIDAEGAQRNVLAIGLHALVHLDRELARGREDQAAHRMQRRREALGGHGREALQERQREAGGLAGAGLRGAEEVASRKDDGNGLRLDGGRFGIALLRDCAKQLGQEPEAFEGRAYVNLLNDRPAKEISFDTGSGR